MTVAGGGAGQTHSIAERLRGLGPVGLLAIFAIVAGGLGGAPVAAVLVLAWAQLSQAPLRALGFTAPPSWTFGIAFKLSLKALVMPLLGAPAVNPRYHYLAGNPAALPGMLATVVISGGFAEEVLFRGYLFERFEKLLGRGKAALAVTAVLSATLFALAHYPDQRLPGAEQATVTGLVFGGIFAWRRQLWDVIMAHVAFDVAAVALIYWGWEAPVAHLLFR